MPTKAYKLDRTLSTIDPPLPASNSGEGMSLAASGSVIGRGNTNSSLGQPATIDTQVIGSATKTTVNQTFVPAP